MMRALAALALLPCAAAAAQTLQPPEVVDLQASYCLVVMRRMVNVGAENANDDSLAPEMRRLAERDLEGKREALRRLEAYLPPRLPRLEREGIDAAAQQAREDLDQAGADMTVCSISCTSKDTIPCTLECSARSPAIAQIRECYEAGFLPR